LGEKWEKRIEKWKISRTAEGTSERKKIPPITEVRQTKSYCNTLLRNRKMANYLPARISARMPTCGAFPALELACHVAVRSEAFHAKAFYASLAATSLCVVLLPLFVTNTLSYGAAVKVCYERTSSRLSSMFLDEDSPRFNPDWDMDSDYTQSGCLLFPQHLCNSLSTAVSLFGFGVWLFFSPHQSDLAKDLDRKRMCINCFVLPLALFLIVNA
jgi:hypothetical protein